MVIVGARALLGIRHEVRGAHNLPDAPAILLSKHQSTWETLFFPAYFPRALCYVFKRELLFVPFFGWGIGLLRHDPHRPQARRRRLRTGGRAGRREGSPTVAGSSCSPRARAHGPARRDATAAAARDSPFAPGRRSFRSRSTRESSGRARPSSCAPGLITVSIGPPIPPQGRSAESLCAEVERWIEAEMRRLSPHLYGERSGKA